MRVLITGGAGFIGNALVHRLLESGHEVAVLDDRSRHRVDGLKSIAKDIELINGDVRDPDAVREALASREMVWHLAAINGTRFFYERPDEVFEVGMVGTWNVLNACIEQGVRRIVYASSSEVYASPAEIPTPESVPLQIPDATNPRSSYGGAKIAGELMMRHMAGPRGLEYVIVRPHNFYGPNMGFEHIIPETVHQLMTLSRELKERKVQLAIQGTGKETRAFCHIQDGVQGIQLAGEKGGDSSLFNIGNDQETDIASVIIQIAQILGLEVEIIPGNIRAGSPLRRCPEISALRSLGFEPHIGIAQGLEETVRWYQSQFSQRNTA